MFWHLDDYSTTTRPHRSDRVFTGLKIPIDLLWSRFGEIGENEKSPEVIRGLEIASVKLSSHVAELAVFTRSPEMSPF